MPPLHFGGPRCDASEIFERSLGNFFVGGEQALDGFSIENLRGDVRLKTRSVVTALAEVLVARGAFLAVPALFVGDNDGGKDGEALDGERNVGQVGNGAVPVLKVESVKKLFCLSAT
jgi:hypothetical protein